LLCYCVDFGLVPEDVPSKELPEASTLTSGLGLVGSVSIIIVLTPSVKSFRIWTSVVGIWTSVVGTWTPVVGTWTSVVGTSILRVDRSGSSICKIKQLLQKRSCSVFQKRPKPFGGVDACLCYPCIT